eukprot:TRINITY_DN25180_c0_g1_i1.p1 TRINITY_DN25180_c0_g1~~TRINITY_DN25180_c0_g1_i1.p1  ORF type:complete len:457 (-),score=85.02 TRINITY_DN25180_c0_g1_i1:59-1429(-)
MSTQRDSKLEWNFMQVFGDKGAVDDVTEADIISTVEFDHTGDFLATGDKGGRVVFFQRVQPSTVKKPGGRRADAPPPEFRFYTEFQSHEPEFDYLKSLEIEEKVNKVKWLKSTNSARLVLTTNDKTVKLWKVYDKQVKNVSSTNLDDSSVSRPMSSSALRFPTLSSPESMIATVPRRVYGNAHAYHINSISLNSDGETYLSADDLRINVWSLERPNNSFNIVDIKPDNMEDLAEVVTAAECHPTHCNLFTYASSKGVVKLADMRISSNCNQHSKLFEEEEDSSSRSFFSEIISSISDVRFSFDGRYILSRDYLTLKIWDINMDRRPVQTIPINEGLRSKLCDLYESDCIFDKFECSFSGDGRYAMTGTYHNNFYVYDTRGNCEAVIEASKPPPRRKQSSSRSRRKDGRRGGDELNVDSLDFTKKALHLAWHPKEPTLAVAAANNLYIYHSQNPNQP